MKEATSELNLTVIIVIAIAGLVALFSVGVWPIIKGGLNNATSCDDAICDCSSAKSGSKTTCVCTKKDGGKEFECPYKG